MKRWLLLFPLLLLSACGQAVSAGSSAPTLHPTAAPVLATPTVAQLTAVGEQLFPQVPRYGYYAECINFPEHGASDVLKGNDYSACPLTDDMRTRLQETQSHLCPCEQNPSVSRAIVAQPRPGGGLLTVQLYGGQITVELVVTAVNGQLLVSDEPAKGSFETTPIVFQDKPAPMATATPTPTAVPPTTNPGGGSRILNVPWYHQAFELSCESASLRMALAYEGIATTDAAILNIVGNDPRPAIFQNGALRWGDPYASFVGNVNGSEIALTGYGMYYPTVVKAARTLGGHVLNAGEGITPAQVYAAVLAGHPVVTWVTYHWVILHRQDYVAFDGRTIPYAGPGEHAVTVVGIEPGRLLINNPWSGPEWISKTLFERIYTTYNDMAVILS
jgi:uncharacterized protein YvpB